MAHGTSAGTFPSAREQLASTSRYELLVKVASGGMATVYVGRLSAASGFRRLVAIKRAHAHLIEDPSFRRMLIAEAKLASMIHHPNVVAVQDVEELEGELLLVMDYIEGASLAELLAKREGEEERPLPARLAVRILLDACAGLHAAHEQRDEDGKPLGLVHRDISPHNILVGIDGVARIADFGIAKSADASAGSQKTATGELKGKVAYMSPEYISGKPVDARSDVFALGVVAWEALARQRLFRGDIELHTLQNVMTAEAPPLSSVAGWVGKSLDNVIAKALEKSPDRRHSSALEVSLALEKAARIEDLVGAHSEVGEHVLALVGPVLRARRGLIRQSKPEPEAAPLPLQPEPIVEPGPTKTLPMPPTSATKPSATAAPISAAISAEPVERTDTRARGILALSEPASAKAPPRSRAPLVVALSLVAVGGLGAAVALGFGSNAKPTPRAEVAAEGARASGAPLETAKAPVLEASSSLSTAPTASVASAASASPSAPPRPLPSEGQLARPTAPARPPQAGKSPRPTDPPKPSVQPRVAPPNPYGDSSP